MVAGFQLLARCQRLLEAPEGVRRLHAGHGGALQKDPPEQALSKRRRAEGTDAGGSGALPGQGHVVRIPAKGGHVVPDPFEGLDLIEKTVVPRGAVGGFRGQALVGQVPEHPQPVAQVHHDHALPGKARARVVRVPGLARLQGAPVDVDQHRQAADLPGGLPNVHVEAVLADGRHVVVLQRYLIVVEADDLGQAVVDGQMDRLHAHGGEMVPIEDALPGQRVLGLLPAQIPHGGLGVGDAGVELHGPVRDKDAPDGPLLDGHGLRVHRGLPLVGGHGPGGGPGQEQDQGEGGEIPRVSQELSIPLAALEHLAEQHREPHRGGHQQRKA